MLVRQLDSVYIWMFEIFYNLKEGIMIEGLIGKLKSEVGGQIANKTKVPSGNLDGIFSVVGNVVTKEATKQMVGGNLSSLMNLFSDKPKNAAAKQIQTKMLSGVISELTSKMGISAKQSKMIAEIALPALINLIAKKNKSKSKDDSSFLNEIFGGVAKGGLGEVAKGLLGLFKK